MEPEDFTIIPLPFWAVLVIIIFCWPSIVSAEPLAKATDGRIVVTLHTEDCAFKSEVTNLSKRATWDEPGKHFEGCWSPMFGSAVFWFEDKSVGHIPGNEFVKVTGA